MKYIQKNHYFKMIKKLLKSINGVIIAHFYTHHDIQQLAEELGGFVGDSLEMAMFGNKTNATTLIIVGVKFMGETAKILNPSKTVLIPNMDAECSLDLSCPSNEFKNFCQKNPDREIVVYANTSAKVKAIADWVVTSSIAVDVINYIHRQGKKIIWAPDKHLGDYIQKKTGADMLLWNGSCIVHEKFKASGIMQLKKLYPEAIILSHPESPPAVLEISDVVGSTSQLLKASENISNKIMIVATESGIIYKMQQKSPAKIFIVAPTNGIGATCKNCAQCPWMAKNTISGIVDCIENIKNEIIISPILIERAIIPLKKMINFKNKN